MFRKIKRLRKVVHAPVNKNSVICLFIQTILTISQLLFDFRLFFYILWIIIGLGIFLLFSYNKLFIYFISNYIFTPSSITFE